MSVYCAGKNIQDVMNIIKCDIKTIYDWLEHNQLILNFSKTNAMLLHYKLHFNRDPNMYIEVDNQKISFVSSVKLLGVTIDEKLNYELHIKNVMNAVNFKTLLISRNLSIFSHKFRPLLFKLFIIPHFDYCSTLFYFTSKKNLNSLSKCFLKSIYRLLRCKIQNCSVSAPFTFLKDLHFKYLTRILCFLPLN